jgi:hypothetical protein
MNEEMIGKYLRQVRITPLVSSNYSCYAVQNFTKLHVDINERYFKVLHNVMN